MTDKKWIEMLQEEVGALKGRNLLLASEKVVMSHRIANLQCQGHQFAIQQLEEVAKEMCPHCRCKMELFPPDVWMSDGFYKTTEWEHACEDDGMHACEAPEIHERIKKIKEG